MRVSGDRRELNFLLSLELLSRQKVHPDLGFVLSTVREYELEILFQTGHHDLITETPWYCHSPQLVKHFLQVLSPVKNWE